MSCQTSEHNLVQASTMAAPLVLDQASSSLLQVGSITFSSSRNTYIFSQPPASFSSRPGATGNTQSGNQRKNDGLPGVFSTPNPQPAQPSTSNAQSGSQAGLFSVNPIQTARPTTDTAHSGNQGSGGGLFGSSSTSNSGTVRSSFLFSSFNSSSAPTPVSDTKAPSPNRYFSG